MSRELPSFDLVVATVGRVEELERLLDSLRLQRHRDLRVLLVDQNPDDRLEHVVTEAGVEVLRLRSEPGLSGARNAGLEHVSADIVAFPDDDCVYPEDVLARVAERLAEDPDLDGLTGRAVDADGRSSDSWKTDRAILDRRNLWNRANAATVFLRRDVASRVGAFDVELGLGSGTPWQSGEEIDYLVRALDSGARIEYDPSLVVEHAVREDDSEVGLRDGASVGYLLRKHRYPRRVVAKMLVRPLGGILVSLMRRDRARSRFHAATWRGRLRGYRRTRSSNSAA